MKGEISQERRDELERLLFKLDLKNDDAAKLHGVHFTTISRWLNMSSPIPLASIRLMQLMEKHSEISSMTKVWWCDPEETDETVS